MKLSGPCWDFGLSRIVSLRWWVAAYIIDKNHDTKSIVGGKTHKSEGAIADYLAAETNHDEHFRNSFRILNKYKTNQKLNIMIHIYKILAALAHTDHR